MNSDNIDTPQTSQSLPMDGVESSIGIGSSSSNSRPPPSPRTPSQPVRSGVLDYCNSNQLIPSTMVHHSNSSSSSSDCPVAANDEDPASGEVGPRSDEETANAESPRSDRAASTSSAGVSPPTSSNRGAGGRNRFKKLILRPLRRARSVGCSEDLADSDSRGRSFGLPVPFGRRSISTKSSSLTPPSVARENLTSTGSPKIRPFEVAASSDSDADDSAISASSSSSIKEASSCSSRRSSSILRFSFLRRHSDECPHDASASLVTSPPDSIPTSDTLRRWAESLDQLLADEYGRRLFGEFLKSEFSEENLEFWLACERYRTSTTAPADQLRAMANDIYADFVVAKAPKEINLDSHTRQQTATNIRHPDRTAFQPAQKRIQALMERDSYRRFIESDIYNGLLCGKAPPLVVESATTGSAMTSSSTTSASPRSVAVGFMKTDKRR